jgi:UDP-N-acetylglucosamine--N-acetylmuramyl-(pentapeptide) pyrophosphoryl-undecaprenol N-acetylglucosamine transferase
VGDHRLNVLLLGGGSGGHVLPGLAVAEALGDEASCFAVCSDRDVDRRILTATDIPFTALPARPPSPRPGPALAFLRGWVTSARVGSRLLREHRIDVVLSTGGFVSPPVAGAARRRRVPVVALCLDVVPGRAISWVARSADRRLSGGPITDGPAAWRSATVTGVPVRRAAIAPEAPATCRRRLGLDPDRPTLLVTGASQGARTLDRLATAVARSAARPMDGWQVIHLTGGGSTDEPAAAWADAGVPACVRPFLDAMGLAWGAADLALSRAGAGSVAEAAANRVPTVFLPYPWHTDGHQARNAAPLEAIGGAIIRTDHIGVDENLADAGVVLAGLLTSAQELAAMKDALSVCPAGSAAALAVADVVRAAARR